MKVEIIRGYDSVKVSEEINIFINIKDVKVIDIKYNSCDNYDNYVDYSALIMYEEKE